MAQLWDNILPSETLRDSRQQILNRDEAVKSQFSGSAFPTTDLVIGMPCYRTDLQRLYYLESTGPSVWIPLPDMGPAGVLPIAQGGTGADSAADARDNLGLGALAVLDAVDTGQITDSSVTNGKLGPDAVDSTKIADNSIGNEHMQDNAIDTNEIVDGAVTLAKLDPTIELGMPSGTRCFFQQTAAPTGWTKDATHNDKAIRIVSGSVASGGSTGFASALGNPAVSGGSVNFPANTGSHVLTESQIPSHSHSQASNTVLYNGGAQWAVPTGGIGSTGGTTGSTGGGSGHSHTLGGSGSLTGATTPINVQYVDVIIAVKD